MNRLLSILVSLFILFLLYLWINHLMTAPDRSGDQQEPILTEDHLTSYDRPDQDNTQVDTRSEETHNPAIDQKEDYVNEPPVAVSDEPSRVVPPPAPPAPSAQVVAGTPTTAAHLIIAGNFLERANAERRVQQLRNLGFDQAEVINFELSEYHTACAGRFTDIAEARRVAKRIRDMHGIDTYVRTAK